MSGEYRSNDRSNQFLMYIVTIPRNVAMMDLVV